MDDRSEPSPGQTPEEVVPSREPTFAELLFSNLKVVGWAVALAVVAYFVWRGLRQLFPEISWLR